MTHFFNKGFLNLLFPSSYGSLLRHKSKTKNIKVILLYPFKLEFMAQTLTPPHPKTIKPNIFKFQIIFLTFKI